MKGNTLWYMEEASIHIYFLQFGEIQWKPSPLKSLFAKLQEKDFAL